MKYKHLFFILFIFLVFDCQSQRKLPISITLDTKTWQISEADKLNIPFDEPFNIVGTFDEGKKVTSVVLKYRLKNHCIESKDSDKSCDNYYEYKKHYFLYNVKKELKPQDDEGYFSLKKVPFNSGSRKFEVLMGPLHANLDYEFKFEFYEHAGIAGEKQKELKSEIFTLTNQTFDFKKKNIDQTNFKKDLQKKIELAVGKKNVFDENGNTIDFSKAITTNGLDQSILSLATKNKAINLIINDRLIYADVLGSYSIKGFVNEIDKHRSFIINAISTLLTSKQYEKVIELPVNSLVSKEAKLKTILEFIIFDLKRWKKSDILNVDTEISESYLVEVLKGRAKMDGILTVPTEIPHLESGQLLLSTLIRLQNYNIGKKALIKEAKLKYLISYLRLWVTEIFKMNNLIKELTNSKEVIPNLYENIYSKFNVENTISTWETLASKESNYIGLDIGYILAPSINSSFIFEGFNFHFRPVNKSVNFTRLRGRDEFFKRFSIAVGIAQRVGSYNDNYKSLIGIGSPVLGIGFRPFKWCRVSSGVLFYEVEDSNPLITSSSVESTLFLSVSLDIAFRDIIRSLAGL